MKKAGVTRTSRDDVIRNIILAHNAYLSAFERQCGINVARWRLLSVMQIIGTCSQSDLTTRTTIGPAAVTRILKDFERDSLIKRETSPEDARQTLVTLTEKGRRLVAKTGQQREKVLAATFDGFDAGDIDAVNELLGRMGANLSVRGE
jgi:DNA-binding MarR family transcriptional regulator